MTQQAAADRYGVPRMTVTDLVAEAQRLKLTADDLDPPPLPPAVTGKWWKGFLARHKSIVALRKGDPLAHNRREVSRQQIDSFFSVLRALANNVWVVGLPPHSTHILQALDVKLMSPLKSNYSTALSLWLLKGNNAHVRMNPADFVDQGR